MNPTFDLAVIGGGPGGSACALAAARSGLTVALFEPQGSPIDKPCGEGCLSSGVRALEQLGLGAALAGGKILRNITYSIPGAAPLVIPFPEVGLAIERHRLASTLDAALARESLILRVPQTARVERAGREFHVQAGGEDFSARTLAVADGTRGRAAGWLRPTRWTDPQRFGLRARCEARSEMDGVLILLGDPNGQIYLTPLPGRRVNIALLLDRAPTGGGASAWLEVALAHPRVAEIAGEMVTEPEVRSLARRMPASPARAGVFLVGDAAGAVDPVVGCGVSVALATGVAAARGARRWIDGESPRKVEIEYVRAVAHETRARARLARLLLCLARHPNAARSVAQVLARMPRVGAAIARVAEG